MPTLKVCPRHSICLGMSRKEHAFAMSFLKFVVAPKTLVLMLYSMNTSQSTYMMVSTMFSLGTSKVFRHLKDTNRQLG